MRVNPTMETVMYNDLQTPVAVAAAIVALGRNCTITVTVGEETVDVPYVFGSDPAEVANNALEEMFILGGFGTFAVH